MTRLGWGHRFLVCRPDTYDVVYEINPWMHKAVRVDREVAIAQWENLVLTLESAGAEVVFQPPVEGLPDLVFTANAGVVNGNTFVPSSFRHPERQGETEEDIGWFAARGFHIGPLPAGLNHEGAGDALPFAGTFLSGYRFRSDIASHAALAAILGVPVLSVELVDERLYHFDLTFCPLDDRRALVAPAGWDRYGARVVEALVPEPFELNVDETFAFCANSVVVGSTVIMPTCSPRLGRQLESWGFDVAICEVGEFLKAGGGCRCLTLALDVALDRSAPDASQVETQTSTFRVR
jgi:N-dimethylarginine dimethylaminohydrolase